MAATAAAAAAASSSSSGSSWKYDVFINFRGEDTRRCLVSHLYKALNQKAINTFIDAEELRKGSDLSQLLTAIQDSRVSIVVFSRNYASSTWCLKELVQILDCMDGKNQLVMPLFYQVDPSDVRKAKRSFEEAFAELEGHSNTDMEEVRRWRSALKIMNKLSKLYLGGTAIKELPASILNLTNLVTLKLNDCRELESLPSSICQMKSLQYLDVSRCSNLEKFPEISKLYLGGTAIKELPASVLNLTSLVTLMLNDCRELESLPSSICHMKSLRYLDVSGCSNLEKFPENSEVMNKLSTENLRVFQAAFLT
ncbi:unnamed protein product [Malus baccata var. baccata]